jgi:hypothetical protein
MLSVRRAVKAVPTDEARTNEARELHETALKAVDRTIRACKQLARLGNSCASREARILAAALHRLSDPLFQTLVPHYENGKWLR